MTSTKWVHLISVFVFAFVLIPSSVCQSITKYKSCEPLQEWARQVFSKNPNPLWRIKEESRCKKTLLSQGELRWDCCQLGLFPNGRYVQTYTLTEGALYKLKFQYQADSSHPLATSAVIVHWMGVQVV